MMKCKWRTILTAGLIAVLLITGITGCGILTEKSDADILEAMSEFTSKDGSCSIYLDSTWTTDDSDMDCWLIAGNARNTDAAMVLQFPKSLFGASITDLSTLVTTMEQSYGVSDQKDLEAPEIPGMNNVSALTCSMSVDGMSGEAYIIYGETDYAFYTMAIIAPKATDTVIRSFQVSCTTFQETPLEVENSAEAELTDTIRWFNATCAILTEYNGLDYNMFGSMPANSFNAAVNQATLSEWWGVTDRATADEIMTWILDEGHRADFAEAMEYLNDAGIGDAEETERAAFLLENFDITAEDAQFNADMYNYYIQYGAGAIDAWDYSRAINLLGSYFIAGYYTEQEALDKSLEVAAIIQANFTSWEDFVENYLRGYEYWAEESSDERRAIYEDLKGYSDSPFGIDWNLTLEKTW